MKKSNYDREASLRHFMTIEEEHAYYNEVLERMIHNPRFYLDNLERLDVFYVSFIDYRPKKGRKKKAL